jgi:hypothetical protein
MVNLIRKMIEPFSGRYATHPGEVEPGKEAILLQKKAYDGL